MNASNHLNPLSNVSPPSTATVFHEWEINGDTRIVRLLTEEPNQLICEVFDRATEEVSRRYISGSFKPGSPFPDRMLYAEHIKQNMHPELCFTRKGPACSAMFIGNTSVYINKWDAGENGDIDLRLFQGVNTIGDRWLWIALDVSTNKQGIWSQPKEAFTLDVISNYAKSCFPVVGCDSNGRPNSVVFHDNIVLNTWDLGGKTVRLVRSGLELGSELICPDQEVISSSISIPSHMTIDDAIKKLSSFEPFIGSDNKITYRPKAIKAGMAVSNSTSDTVFHEWEINGDTRVVRILTEDPDQLICEVFDRATQEVSRRYISGFSLPDRMLYAEHIKKNMHPELCFTRKGPACSTMLIENTSVYIEKWDAGENGQIDLRLFQSVLLTAKSMGIDNGQELFEAVHLPDKWIWIAVDISTNKGGIWSQPKEALTLDVISNYVKSCFPVVEYDSNGRPNSVVFHDNLILNTWNVEKKTVSLIRSGFELKSELIFPFPDQRVIRSNVPIPSHIRIEDAIKKLSSFEPCVGSDNTVTFRPKPTETFEYVPQPSAPDEVKPVQPPPVIRSQPVRSKLDPRIMVDDDNWTVTLADTGGSRFNKGVVSYGLLSAGGHATIFVETVKNNIHQIYRMDLILNDTCTVESRIIKVPLADLEKIISKSVTWVRDKRFVQKMIDNIQQEINQQKQGRAPVEMDLRGHGAFTVSYRAHNCFTWAREKLGFAQIRLCRDTDDELTPTLIITPKLNISSTSLGCKERIMVVAPNGDLVNIAEGVDRILEYRPWKLLNYNIDFYSSIRDVQLISEENQPIIFSEFQLAQIQTKIDEKSRGRGLPIHRITPENSIGAAMIDLWRPVFTVLKVLLSMRPGNASDEESHR